jgi:hypothetical protein
MTALGTPIVSNFNTTTTNNMGPDGFTWASASAKIIDRYGKSIIIAEDAGGDHHFVYSNNGEVTWTDGLAVGFITRGDMAYDGINDKVHVFWQATATTDGMIYRRYIVGRDGSHNITGLTQEAGINLQVDNQGSDPGDPGANMIYAAPRIIFMDDIGANGAVLLTWMASNGEGDAGHLGGELRTTMRVLSNSTADNTASSWVPPAGGAGSVSTIGNAPGGGALKYTALRTTTSLFSGLMCTTHRMVGGLRDKCIYVGYVLDDSPGGPDYVMRFRFLRMNWNAGSNNWPTATAPQVLSDVATGTDGGYSFKSELLTKFVHDVTDDYLFIAMPVWYNDTLGDTILMRRIDVGNNDIMSVPVIVYSAGGAHFYAPTCDLEFDTQADRLMVSYIATPTQYAFFKTYMPDLTLDQDATLYYSGGTVDIPLLYQGRIGDKIVCMFRDTTGTFVGTQVTMTWVVTPDVVDESEPEVMAGGAAAPPRLRLQRRSLLFDRYLTPLERSRLEEIYAIQRR